MYGAASDITNTQGKTAKSFHRQSDVSTVAQLVIVNSNIAFWNASVIHMDIIIILCPVSS